jgi:hypothetical protein
MIKENIFMLILAYIAVSVSILNVWAVAGIIALATRNWHPIKNFMKRGK